MGLEFYQSKNWVGVGRLSNLPVKPYNNYNWVLILLFCLGGPDSLPRKSKKTEENDRYGREEGT